MQKTEILLIEDEDADVELISEVLNTTEPQTNLTVISEGNHVLKNLSQRLKDNKPLPSLIILDLNLPGKSGFEVLEELKNHRSLKAIPVLIMTSSGDQRDVDRVYKLCANSYVQKSLHYDEFRKKVLHLSKFWFDSSRLPFQAAT